MALLLLHDVCLVFALLNYHYYYVLIPVLVLLTHICIFVFVIVACTSASFNSLVLSANTHISIILYC